MKTFHSVVLALAIGAASITSAQARDSFSLGINVGGYGYAPPPVYYAAPPVVYYERPVVYYERPVVYYQPAPRYYGYGPSYAPVVSYQYYNNGYDGHRGRGDWDHRGWNKGDRGHGGGRDHDDGHHGHHDWR